MIRKSHHYYMLNFRPWPLLIIFSFFNIIFSFLIFVKFSEQILFVFNSLILFTSSLIWWIFYRSEFNLEGFSSFNLDLGLKFSILLFISSEVFFFFSFFWSYFHYFLRPVLEIGLTWPSGLIQSFDCFNVPLINTLLLLSSGVTVTLRHHYLIEGENKRSNFYLVKTIFLGLIFTSLQLMEYASSFFRIGDSTFGTSFFILTGFHGLHVLIGTIFLALTFWRNFNLVSSKNEWLRFELASWYWHFVDVVWIFLYFILYYVNN